MILSARRLPGPRQAGRIPLVRLAAVALLALLISLAGWSLGALQAEPPWAGAADDECLPPVMAPTADQLRALYSQSQACWPAAEVDPGIRAPEPAALPPAPHPEDNPYTTEKAELGKHLFFDPRLSGSRQIACASCHDPDLGWGDGRRRPFGHDRLEGGRNSPTLLNAGHHQLLMWDGRFARLEEQAIAAIINPIEMNAEIATVLDRLSAIRGYDDMFSQAFGSDGISEERMAQAIATFVRTINSRTSRLDRFISGESRQLDDAQLRGLHLFRTKARCMNCHHGPLLSDGGFHNLGLHFHGRRLEDLGRYELTGNPADAGAFRTPSLRDVTLRGPWMHNGMFHSLESVINFYNAGGAHPTPRQTSPDRGAIPATSPLLRPLELTAEERADLLAFLEAISRTPTRITPPERLH